MTEVEQVAKRYQRAAAQREAAMLALRSAVRSAAEQGVSEAELARQAGVTRMTVRKMLGK